MVLHPVRFLWKQFNGPQITAIMTAVFRWFKDGFNNTLEYLTTLSVNTANDSHLTLVGACMGVSRPIVEISDMRFFLFTRDPEHGQENGVSEVGSMVGGVFSDLQQDLRSKKHVLCPATYYRIILQACRKSTATVGSLKLIDDMLYNIWTTVHPNDPPVYSFRYYTDGESLTRTNGDIEILLGPRSIWGDADVSAMWIAVLKVIINKLLNPNSYVECNFTAG